MSYIESTASLLAQFFQFLPGLIIASIAISVAVMWVNDKRQHHHTIRRNYPVIGRFRYLFEEVGVFFRAYLSSNDREEMPFNRAERSWVYRASKDQDTTQTFGSTKIPKEGDVLFSNSIIPYCGNKNVNNEKDVIVFGPYCNTPFVTRHYFHISGMSYGALSMPAVQALCEGASMAGIWINTGEGGPTPHHLTSGASVIVQIGTAKYGVRNASGRLSSEKLKALAENPNIKAFSFKLSQGAKPGKGGILPASKVTKELAEIRGIEIGKDSISPAYHDDIPNYEALFQRIHDVRSATGKPVGFKLCIGSLIQFRDMLRTLRLIANKRRDEASESGLATPHDGWVDDTIKYYAPDFIEIDSGDGGTGAAPMSHMENTGMNIRQSLPEAVNILEELGLKQRIRVVASGKLITPTDVAWALCAGADAVVSARGFMFAMGCIQAMQCNKNTCPTGITSHDRRYHKGLDPEIKSVRVAKYAMKMHDEVDSIAQSCGVKNGHKLNRGHAMIFVSNQNSIPMKEVY